MRGELVELRRTALRLAITTVVLAGTYVALSSTPSGAATSASRGLAVERRDQR